MRLEIKEKIFSRSRFVESLQTAKKQVFFCCSIRYIDEAQDGQKWRFSA